MYYEYFHTEEGTKEENFLYTMVLTHPKDSAVFDIELLDGLVNKNLVLIVDPDNLTVMSPYKKIVQVLYSWGFDIVTLDVRHFKMLKKLDVNTDIIETFLRFARPSTILEYSEVFKRKLPTFLLDIFEERLAGVYLAIYYSSVARERAPEHHEKIIMSNPAPWEYYRKVFKGNRVLTHPLVML